MENNEYLIDFAQKLSKLTGQRISPDCIFPSPKGRNFYIQPPKQNAPILLFHYEGCFVIDLHPDDFEALTFGKVSVHDYITSANWLVGYYRCCGSMVNGGYYQPLDIVGNNVGVRRYLQLLSCREYNRHYGYRHSEMKCADCFVDKCPLSKYKEGGNLDAEMHEPDPRCDLFEALCERFEQENPGYTLHGFFCEEIPDEEIWITPNMHNTWDKEFCFTAYVSASVIRALLMGEIKPENWTEYAKSFQFCIHKFFDRETYPVTNENLKMAFSGRRLYQKGE